MPELIGYLRGVHAGVSGARDDRAGLALMLAHAHEGDTVVVVVVALDWLGRSLSGTIRTVATLAGRGIVLWLLRESSTPLRPSTGCCRGVFGSLAEYERSLIAERSAAAREAARARGKQTGARVVLLRARLPGGLPLDRELSNRVNATMPSADQRARFAIVVPFSPGPNQGGRRDHVARSCTAVTALGPACSHVVSI